MPARNIQIKTDTSLFYVGKDFLKDVTYLPPGKEMLTIIDFVIRENETTRIFRYEFEITYEWGKDKKTDRPEVHTINLQSYINSLRMINPTVEEHLSGLTKQVQRLGDILEKVTVSNHP